MSTKKLNLFQYAILHHPEEGKTVLVKNVDTVLAESDKTVAMIAAREIPKEHLDDLTNVEIVVRPF